ncbi:hypothetical protein BG004_002505 [Podila humilis]|nr:hypothetical protein BG004_002505 [Podila humilis]
MNRIDEGDKLAHLLIRNIAFHPHLPLLAIALWNNSVWIYDLNHKAWCATPLAHKELQTRVISLQWKPMSGTVLTVGCRDGVSIWHVHRGNYVQDPFSRDEDDRSYIGNGNDPKWGGLSQFTEMEGDVDHMEWDPRGEALAVSSAQSSTVYIRDVATNLISELPGTLPSVTKRTVSVSVVANVVCALAWSPNGEYLLVGYWSGLVRIYSAATWDALEITDLAGPLKSVCWTPDGHNLIYVINNDHVIRALHLEKRAGELTWIRLNFVTLSLLKKDIQRYHLMEKENPAMAADLRRRLGGMEVEDLEPFGPVEQLVLDPNGERLVVRFRNTNLLGVVLVRPTGVLLRDLDIFMPLGFIRGPVQGRGQQDGIGSEKEVVYRNPKAIAMSFASEFGNGSLLSLAWESGAVTFTPFYYLSQRRIDTRL